MILCSSGLEHANGIGPFWTQLDRNTSETCVAVLRHVQLSVAAPILEYAKIDPVGSASALTPDSGLVWKSCGSVMV